MNPWFRLIPLGILFLLALVLASGLLNSEQPKKTVSLVGYHAAPFSVPTLPVAGQAAGKMSPDTWRGEIAVLNVFASWCEPCASEHPVMMRLAQASKVPVYGLAWKDTPEKVSAWLSARGNPYQVIGIDSGGRSTIPLALTGVPETLLFDEEGSVVYHHKSAIDDETVDKVLLPLVEKLRAGEL